MEEGQKVSVTDVLNGEDTMQVWETDSDSDMVIFEPRFKGIIAGRIYLDDEAAKEVWLLLNNRFAQR